ncbi:MAG: hypothetical protein ABI927_08340, partial [Gaiellaceae bacterium]
RQSLQAERLRDDLRRHFPPGAGYEVSEATWVESVDGKLEFIPVSMVTGNGVDLTFFPRAANNPPGSSRRRADDGTSEGS